MQLLITARHPRTYNQQQVLAAFTKSTQQYLHAHSGSSWLPLSPSTDSQKRHLKGANCTKASATVIDRGINTAPNVAGFPLYYLWLHFTP